MNLRSDTVVLPTGVVLPEFHVVEYPDWVGVLAVTEDSRAILVEQYRYGIDSVNLELPAGRVDDGEDIRVAAGRELLEETGYEPASIEFIGSCAQEPAKHSNYAHLYFAANCKKTAEPNLDDSEDLLVRLVPLDRLWGLVESGQIVHGIHIMAIMWAAKKGLIV